MNIQARFPSKEDMLCVYAVSAFMDYSWMALLFFFNMPSFFLNQTILEVLGIFSYGAFLCLADSVLQFLIITACAVALPAKFLRDEFASRGGMMALLFFIWIFSLRLDFATYWSGERLLQLLLYAVLSMVVMVFLVARVAILKRLMDGFARRAAVFAYIYPPLGVIGLLIVIARNIF